MYRERTLLHINYNHVIVCACSYDINCNNVCTIIISIDYHNLIAMYKVFTCKQDTVALQTLPVSQCKCR